MKILFVQAFHATYGVECLSAYLKSRGYDVDFVFDPCLMRLPFLQNKISKPSCASSLWDVSDQVATKVAELSPDLVCYSVMYDLYQWARLSAKAVKAQIDVPIVFGGIHPTSVPENVLKDDFVDYAIRGEGEGALFELAQALENQTSVDSIKNLAYVNNGEATVNPLRPLIEDLDSLPDPDKDLFRDVWDIQHPHSYHTMATRNCPYRCSYCCHSFLRDQYKGLGKYVRQKSVDTMIEELVRAREKYPLKTILFHDEVFTANKKWFRKFASEYKRHVGLPYFAWISPGTADAERINLLADSGCKTVEIGVQAAPGADQHDILNRKRQFEQTTQALELLRSSKIFTVADTIVGLPGQTEDAVAGLIRFFLDTPVEMIAGYWLRYYPKTAIVEIAHQAGELSDEQVRQIENGRNVLSFTFPAGDTADSIYRLGTLLQLTMILPRRFILWLLESPSRLRKVPRLPLFKLAQYIQTVKAKIVHGKRRIPLVFEPMKIHRFFGTILFRRICRKFFPGSFPNRGRLIR